MTYATLKSIKKDVARLKDIGIDTLLIDECHSGYSPEEGSEFMEFMNGFPEAKVMASPPLPAASEPTVPCWKETIASSIC